MWGTYRREKANGDKVWLSKININKKQINGGTFKNQFDAHKRSIQLYEEITGMKWKSEIEKRQNPDTLFDVLDYCPETGSLRWKAIINRKRGDLAGREVGNLGTGGYLQMEFNYKYYSVHRVCFYLYHGRWPKNQIDHINGNRTDNRISNLREVTKHENAQNQTEHREGKLWGALYHRQREELGRGRPWQAGITVKGKQIHIGFFGTELEAHKASIAYALKNSIPVLIDHLQRMEKP